MGHVCRLTLHLDFGSRSAAATGLCIASSVDSFDIMIFEHKGELGFMRVVGHEGRKERRVLTASIITCLSSCNELDDALSSTTTSRFSGFAGGSAC